MDSLGDGEVESCAHYCGGGWFRCWPQRGLVQLLAAAGGEIRGSGVERQAERLAEFQQRIRELDSACYETRRFAAVRIEQLLGMPEMTAMLAEQFQQFLLQPELPYEVRRRIATWQKQLPSVRIEPPQFVPLEEIQRLVRQLDENSYAVRCAAQRLRWMAGARACETDHAHSEASFGRSDALRGTRIVAWN